MPGSCAPPSNGRTRHVTKYQGSVGTVRWKGLARTLSTKKIYRVTVEREPGFWIIRVPELKQVVTQARRLADVKLNAQEAIAVWLDKRVDDIDVSVDIKLPVGIQSALDDAQTLRQEANARLERAGNSLSEVARAMTKDFGMTLRETAEVLGISFQRVAQLVEKSKLHDTSHRRRGRGPRVGV